MSEQIITKRELTDEELSNVFGGGICEISEPNIVYKWGKFRLPPYSDWRCKECLKPINRVLSNMYAACSHAEEHWDLLDCTNCADWDPVTNECNTHHRYL